VLTNLIKNGKTTEKIKFFSNLKEKIQLKVYLEGYAMENSTNRTERS